MSKCKNCQKDFSIEPEDRKFYEKIGVPDPIECPACRQQKRLSFRCERSLHFRKCDNCGKKHMSSYQSDAPYPIYCLDCWYGDGWDQLKNGREFDFSRPFFEQFAEVQKTSPRASLFVTRGTIFNSDYVNAATNVKNSYMSFGANDSEDTYYCNFFQHCFYVCDCTEIFKSERCFDCVATDNCYGVVGSNNVRGCRDCYFLEDCSGCHDCFGGVNLRNREYCFWNEQLTKEEYKKKFSEVNLRSRKVYEEMKNKFNSFKVEKGIYKYYHGNSNVNCSGDSQTRCKNTQYGFDCHEAEDCKYVSRLSNAKDCFDVDYFGFGGLELSYNSNSVGRDSTNLKMCTQCWNLCGNLEYCDNCQNGSKDCFGCVCLTKKQYCILNKQYAEEEYNQLVPKIIEHMRKTGEYGLFFPSYLAYTPYNDSIAQDYYPLTKEEALEKGWRWAEEEKKPLPATSELPDDFSNIDEDKISKEIFVCKACGKNFKLVAQELKLYKELGVCPSDLCYNCRIIARLKRKNPRQLYDRTCVKCNTAIKTTYAPERTEKVYCEECYQKEIY